MKKVSPIRHLDPFMYHDNEKKHPLILPKKEHVTELVMRITTLRVITKAVASHMQVSEDPVFRSLVETQR